MANRKTDAKAADTRPERKSSGKAARPPKVPFPKKNQPPSEAEFVARLPLAAGKKFEAIRVFLKKQKDVSEELYYYGPKTGWAYRYLRGAQSIATVMIHEDRLVGIVSMEAAATAAVDWAALSDVAQQARKMAHGSPSLLWLDVPLDGTGASDFKSLLKAKLKAIPVAAAAGSGSARSAPGRSAENGAPPAQGQRHPPPPPPRRARAEGV